MPRTSSIEATFKCTKCDKKYAYATGLCAHVKKNHPPIPSPSPSPSPSPDFVDQFFDLILKDPRLVQLIKDKLVNKLSK